MLSTYLLTCQSLFFGIRNVWWNSELGFRLSQQCCWRSKATGMWWCVVEQTSHNILRNDSAFKTLHSTCAKTAAHYHLHQALQEPDCSTMKTKALGPLKTSGTICPMTQWHTPECLDLQQYHCVNLKSYDFQVLQTRVVRRSVRTFWCFQGWSSSSPWRKVATFLPNNRASRPTECSAAPLRKP